MALLWIPSFLASAQEALHQSPAATEEVRAEPTTRERGYLRRAVELKSLVNTANESDLNLLIKALQDRLEESRSSTFGPELVAQVTEQIQNDKTQLIEIKKELDAKTGDDRGLPPLRTSLGKLLGDAKYSGILDDALAMLNASWSDLSRGQKPAATLSGNQITVLKTLLMYMVRESKAKMPELQLVYPAPIPAHVTTALTQKTKLISEVHENDKVTARFLQVPNAGFIFGGEMQNGQCRGIDCSTFLSYATLSSVRLSTMVMEYTYRELTGDAFTEVEEPIRTEFKEKWGMREALNEYQAVRVDEGEKVRPGDLIVWRWTPANSKVRAGHVVMYSTAVPEDEGKFVGIEANREDDKSREGIFYSIFDLQRTNADLYVLRRKGE
ncbi:MAG TPA: hypothetical protein VM901_04030 [Bdellovibrionota bacterium]|nr:hypothetical protein [Bdellovibrionota bacterium]